MKKYIIIVGLIIAALAILLPFVSTTPDSLQTLVEASEAEESTWSGLIGDYTIAAISNPYLSTLLAGILGTAIVFLVTFVLGAKISPKKKENQARTF
jgi:hypothetical protein